MEKEKEFLLRGYTKGELALLYNPEMTKANALKVLNRWIRVSPGLEDELHASGYELFTHWLTPKQVSMIVERLGAP